MRRTGKTIREERLAVRMNVGYNVTLCHGEYQLGGMGSKGCKEIVTCACACA